MATDTRGKKAWFSNEGYEMAAPGDGILSTLPNHQYAAWSGTSMAAPVVSGIAALMRSHWWQRDIYSSRFIMGGLSAACFDPSGNFGPVNAFKALTELPQPGVELLRTWLFDGKGIDVKNDADGRIDSGETVHLAIEAINRSGDAKNVVATLRARAEGAVLDDPYVTFVTNTVNFGDIGPFNTADNGFIYNTSGVITGVEHPFVMQVSNDCPNDHIVSLEITFTFLDGWDPGNTTPFTRVDRFTFTVQRGKNIPSVISSNMTLTADEFWIVGGPVLIEPAATLTIMPGTQVQWGGISTDPYNPGPQTGNVVVRGKLVIGGTLEQPVIMFPSSLVGGQTVKVVVEGAGRADMSYTKVRTANLTGFSVIDHGYFDADVGGGATITAKLISNSVFYRLMSGGISANCFECCLFGAGRVSPGGSRLYNCAFLQDNENNSPLSLTAFTTLDKGDFGGYTGYYTRGIHELATFGTNTYAAMAGSSFPAAELIAQYFGGHVVSVNSAAEQAFLTSYVSAYVGKYGKRQCGGEGWVIGLNDQEQPGVHVWPDGSPVTYTNWDTATGYPAVNYAKNTVFMGRWTDSCTGTGYGGGQFLGPWRNQGPVTGVTMAAAWYILEFPGSRTQAELNAPVLDGTLFEWVRPRVRGWIRHNAFLSKYWDPNVSRWMRVVGSANVPNTYSEMFDNYWGTNSTDLIDYMIVDYKDNFTSSHIDYQPPPAHGYATTYPFVEQVLINGMPADSVPKLSGGRVDFTVTFNRDMDMTVEPFVTFGPSSPHTDFQVTARDADFQPITNGWLNPRTWQGSAWITPMSGDGYHLMRISGAVAASDPWLVSGYDVGRFRFEVRSMEVAAMTLQASGLEGAIQLSWQQDDFDLLAGYNLYRATSATGPWTKLNNTVIPLGSENYTDRAVAPAAPMYYKFTVLSTDFKESVSSNVAMAAAVDTISPAITHVPVTTAAPARGLRVTATATDNLQVTAVTAHYRALGGDGTYTAMALANLTGNQWTGTIPGAVVTEPGLEYYLVATDGISDAFSGSPVLPHQVTVSNVPTLASVTPNHGPATGGTSVTLSGVLFEPGISVLFGGMLASNVEVLNANQLTCVTPAHFPALVDVKVINPDNRDSTLLNAFRFEETGVVVSLPNSSGDYGAQVEVAVSAANLVGLRGVDLTITWNPAVLSAVSARIGTITAGWGLATNLSTAGRAVFSMANSGAVGGSGSLVIVRFNVVGVPPATSALTIASVSLNDGAMTTSRSDGLFTVNGFFDLAGTVRYFQGAGAVPGVSLNLDGVASFPAVSAGSGAFAFTDIPIGGYILTPSKTDGAAEITAYDAALILQRAAGLTVFSADQTRAADVNRNGTVSAMDASYVLEKAVGLLELPFPGAGRVWDFLPEGRTYSLLNADLTNQDFTAVLLGDVSGNWTPGAAPAPPIIQSGTAAFALIHDAVNIADPNTAWLLVKTTQPAIYGLDLSVSYDPALTLLEVRAGSLGSNHTVAFHSPVAGSARIAAASALPVSGEGVMLELRFSGPPANVAVTSVQFDEARVSAVADPALDVFDTDHDGIINTLETEVYHTNPAVADSDGDGQNDGQEVIAGTSPIDAASVFALKAVENQPGDTLRLTWSSVPGRTYRVEVSQTLAAGQWLEACPAITATTGLTTITVAKTPAHSKGFYRIAVAAP